MGIKGRGSPAPLNMCALIPLPLAASGIPSKPSRKRCQFVSQYSNHTIDSNMIPRITCQQKGPLLPVRPQEKCPENVSFAETGFIKSCIKHSA